MAAGVTPRALTVTRILSLQKEGLSNGQIAVRLGLAKSTVRNYLDDPDGAKDRARKDSYRQPCPRCGRLMAGQDGPNVAPERCRVCAEEDLRSTKHWTRERVIDAIRRFAAEHGRPPIANEWITANVGNGYPSRNSVYRSQKRSSSPFARWADAIEAAGFPRPDTGRRTYGEGDMTQARAGYTILRENEKGAWEVVGTYDSHSQIAALNEALNGSEPAGRWVAVPGRYWQPRGLRPKTVYDWVEASAE